jgi:hypothetical protein
MSPYSAKRSPHRASRLANAPAEPLRIPFLAQYEGSALNCKATAICVRGPRQRACLALQDPYACSFLLRMAWLTTRYPAKARDYYPNLSFMKISRPVSRKVILYPKSFTRFLSTPFVHRHLFSDLAGAAFLLSIAQPCTLSALVFEPRLLHFRCLSPEPAQRRMLRYSKSVKSPERIAFSGVFKTNSLANDCSSAQITRNTYISVTG